MAENSYDDEKSFGTEGKEENEMSSLRSAGHAGQNVIALLVGVGVGVGLALLFAPQSGAETREWISDTADDGMKQLRKTGRQTLRHVKAAVSKGEEAVSNAFESGKEALENLSAKLG